MTYEICRAARKRLRQLATDRAEEFEATILHNRVHEAIDLQGTHAANLRELLDVTERAYDLDADRQQSVDTDDDLRRAAFDAAETLNDHVDAVVDEVVAATLAELLEEVDEWGDAWGDEEIAAAKHEAREWLQTHTDAAERAGALGEVSA